MVSPWVLLNVVCGDSNVSSIFKAFSMLLGVYPKHVYLGGWAWNLFMTEIGDTLFQFSLLGFPSHFLAPSFLVILLETQYSFLEFHPPLFLHCSMWLGLPWNQSRERKGREKEWDFSTLFEPQVSFSKFFCIEGNRLFSWGFILLPEHLLCLGLPLDKWSEKREKQNKNYAFPP